MQEPINEKIKKRNRFFNELLVVMLLAAATSFGCKPTKSESISANKAQENQIRGESAVVLTHGVKAVSLEIENPNQLPATLYRIDGNEKIPVQELGRRIGEAPPHSEIQEH